jgi:hypothetical protein
MTNHNEKLTGINLKCIKRDEYESKNLLVNNAPRLTSTALESGRLHENSKILTPEVGWYSPLVESVASAR